MRPIIGEVEKMIIKFLVEEQTIQLKTNKCIASDTINSVELNFNFCDCWAEYDKTVQFIQQTNIYSVNLGTTGSMCYLPTEVTDGLCSISVFGIKEDKRITTIPCQIRIKRSGFMEGGIIPGDTQLTVIEQLIQDTKKLKEDISGLEEDISGLKSSMVAIPGTNQNRLAEVFDLEFAKGYHSGGIDVYYDKTTNKLTINGTTNKDVSIGATSYKRKAFLSLGCYEFVNCQSGNIFEGTTSSLPFKLSLNAKINENVSIGSYAIITDKTTAAAEPNTYNVLRRDCFVGMALVIPAGSSFDNEEFYPWLMRYSACIE